MDLDAPTISGRPPLVTQPSSEEQTSVVTLAVETQSMFEILLHRFARAYSPLLSRPKFPLFTDCTVRLFRRKPMSSSTVPLCSSTVTNSASRSRSEAPCVRRRKWLGSSAGVAARESFAWDAELMHVAERCAVDYWLAANS